MKNAWPILLLLIYLEPTSSEISCNNSNNCLCLIGPEYEIQCPKGGGDFLIRGEEAKRSGIDCGGNLTKFDINLLPKITLERLKTFTIKFSPSLPENGFKEIFDRFALKEVEVFRYESAIPPMANVTLKKDMFEGLDFVKNLSLNANGLVDLEEDVFANTPNLVSLDLYLNNIKLKPNLFKYTPFLICLDLSANQLKELPDTLFHNFENLKLLYLWDNSLTEIDDMVFSRLINLQFLELSANKISKISENAFKNLIELRNISLTRNRLKRLPGDIFAHNKKIEFIFLKYNQNLKLARHVFANLTRLQQVDLSSCDISEIPDDIFDNSQNIKAVKMSSNHLEYIPPNLFRGLSNLEEIDLSNNRIVDIDNAFSGLKKLKRLNLQNNKIVEINNGDVFKDLTSLEEINLEANQIRTISVKAFNDLNLKVINLSHNQYSGTSNDLGMILLENVNNVEKIDLSYNLIKNIGDVIIIDNKVKLTYLNLTHNQISYVYVKDLLPLSKTKTIDLRYNKIKKVDFVLADEVGSDVEEAYSSNSHPHTTINIAHNPIECNCNNYDLLRYYRGELSRHVKANFDIKSDAVVCGSPPELKDKEIEGLSPKLIQCSFEQLNVNGSCPEGCSCNWRPSDNTIFVDCSNKNLSEFPHTGFSGVRNLDFTQTEMHLQGNSLVGGLDTNLIGYENIAKIYLSNNEIKTISWIPPNLEELFLDNNKLEYLHYEVLDILNKSSLQKLVLGGNPWHCDCRAVNFTNFLRQHTKMVDADDITCANSTRRLIDLNRHDLCSDFKVVHLVIIILMVALPIAIAAAVFYSHQQEIKVWLYAHNLCLWWVTQEELDKDKIYDAFISYSHRDEDFVVQNLIPVLEGGPSPYKLCLHYRHFIPGEFITSQITRSVLESRRTLVVLSNNFLESVWGKMEFRTAHTQAMAEGLARVIIVLYGDVDTEKLDDELKSYLKTNTYVKWGDPYFWNKLKYALPHSKSSVSRKYQKIANVVSDIDDKFKSFMPVLAVEANGLSTHPLSVVSSEEPDTPPVESDNLLVSTCL